MKVLKLSIQTFFIIVPIFVFSQIDKNNNQQKIDTTNFYYNYYNKFKYTKVQKQLSIHFEAMMLRTILDIEAYFIAQPKQNGPYYFSKMGLTWPNTE